LLKGLWFASVSAAKQLRTEMNRDIPAVIVIMVFIVLVSRIIGFLTIFIIPYFGPVAERAKI
jgi:hypothetical protein